MTMWKCLEWPGDCGGRGDRDVGNGSGGLGKGSGEKCCGKTVGRKEMGHVCGIEPGEEGGNQGCGGPV